MTKIKLVLLALSAGLVMGTAEAAPVLQSCAPMEILHSGDAGLSFELSCKAADWVLTYQGSVPAGMGSSTVQYRVALAGKDGAKFALNRSVQLASSALLGQALAREAVSLDTGEVAFKDCREFTCATYKPMPSQSGMSRASVVVPPEVLQLRGQVQVLQRQNTDLVSKLATCDQTLNAVELERAALAEKAQLRSAGDVETMPVSSNQGMGAHPIAKNATLEKRVAEQDAIALKLQQRNEELSQALSVSEKQRNRLLSFKKLACRHASMTKGCKKPKPL